MNTITYTCELVTPMFMAGADGLTPELRAPSIKGTLRYWWRAINGHLDLQALRMQEDAIFGSGGENSSRSRVLIEVEAADQLTSASQTMVHSRGLVQQGFHSGQQIRVQLTYLPKTGVSFSVEKMAALFELTCVLGGFGKRSRRGRGVLRILQVQQNYLPDQPFQDIATASDISSRLSQLSSFYEVANSRIVFTKQGKTEDYPHIRTIDLGAETTQDLLRRIDTAAHEGLNHYGNEYEATIGRARGGRFSSPAYTSVIRTQTGWIPIITTMKNVQQKDPHNIKQSILSEFKEQIL